MRTLPLIFLTASAIASADVSLHFTDGSYLLVSGNQVALGDDDSHILFEVGQDTFVIVDNENRTHMEIGEDFFGQMGTAMAAQMEQMLSELPPEQQQMYRESMQSGMPEAGGQLPKTTLRETGDTDEVAGFDCKEIEIVDEAGDVGEVTCAATASELGVSRQEYATMVSATEALSKMVGLDDDSMSVLNFEAIGGIPIRTRDLEDGNDSELISVSKDPIDAARFQVPADYRKVTIAEVMGGE